jgi:type II secretory pathway component PulC
MSQSSERAPMQGRSGNLFGGGLFILGFLAGFLVAFIMREKMTSSDSKMISNETLQSEPKQKPVSEIAEKLPNQNQEFSKLENEQNVEISKATRDHLLTIDFMSLLQDAELHRFRYEGETRGVTLTKIRTGSIYEKVGFKDGDIIEKINGIAVGEVEKSSNKMRQELPGAEKITFTVRRGEQKVTIKVKVTNQP